MRSRWQHSMKMRQPICLPPGWSDPYTDAGLPSPINAQGMGYRRGIKPDLLAPADGLPCRTSGMPRDTGSLQIYDRAGAPGQLVASPGVTPGDQGAMRHSTGTSNAPQ